MDPGRGDVDYEITINMIEREIRKKWDDKFYKDIEEALGDQS